MLCFYVDLLVLVESHDGFLRVANVLGYDYPINRHALCESTENWEVVSNVVKWRCHHSPPIHIRDEQFLSLSKGYKIFIWCPSVLAKWWKGEDIRAPIHGNSKPNHPSCMSPNCYQPSLGLLATNPTTPMHNPWRTKWSHCAKVFGKNLQCWEWRECDSINGNGWQ